MERSAKKAEAALSHDKGIKIMAMIWETNQTKMTPVTISSYWISLDKYH